MTKIFLLSLSCFLVFNCNTKNDINEKIIDSVCEINIQNRSSDFFGGIDEINITDKKEITSICKELLTIKKEINLQTRPYKGTILINFKKKDINGIDVIINELTTRIIIKPNKEYYITYSRGQYISDHFLARIIKYLKIDGTKVTALDVYQKSSAKQNNISD